LILPLYFIPGGKGFGSFSLGGRLGRGYLINEINKIIAKGIFINCEEIHNIRDLCLSAFVAKNTFRIRHNIKFFINE